MKNILLAIICIIFSPYFITSQALVFEGSEWHFDYSFGFWDPETVGFAHLEYNGDTVIQGQLAHEIISTIYNVDQGTSYSSDYETKYVYSNNDQVYHLVNDEFKLLYDLNANVGDTLEIYNSECFGYPGYSVVDSTGTVNINGEELRFIHLSHVPGNYLYYTGYFFERIGAFSESGFYSSYLFPQADCIADGPYYSALRCYSDNQFEVERNGIDGDCDYGMVGIFQIPNLLNVSVYPNPNHGVFRLEIEHTENIVIEVLSPTGQTILTKNIVPNIVTEFDLSSFANGLYFINCFTNDAIGTAKILKH